MWKAEQLKTGLTVAIKEISIIQDNTQKHLLMVARELIILQNLSKISSNQFTVKLIDAFVNSEAKDHHSLLKKVYLVMEYTEFDM